SRRMLIRGAGPTLANLGVPGVLADPVLTLSAQSTGQVLRTNDNWGTGDEAPIIASAASAAGAFPFPAGSRDAAMIVMLPPGAYTVQLAGVGGGTGVGIVEVYDVDRRHTLRVCLGLSPLKWARHLTPLLRLQLHESG
ncbi:MAG: hypothetical protein RL479_1658, partial [Verrucomicrobiota bacterium]